MTEEMLAKSVFLVEATSFEQQCLWSRYSPEAENNSKFFNPVKSWESISRGEGLEIGQLNGMPVFVSFSWAKINGQLITFYCPTSQVVDYRMIEEWLGKRFSAKWDNGSRKATCDAQNFHHCIFAVNERNKS